MRKLIIIGASDFGCEVLWQLKDILGYTFCGFIDDVYDKDEKNGYPVLGDRTWIQKNDTSDYCFSIAIGKPSVKKELSAYLKIRGCKLATLIHPSVIIAPDAQIGEGSFLAAGSIVANGVEIGKHTILNFHCTVGHYTKIGDYCTINPGCNVSGNVNIGEGVYIGTNTGIFQKVKVGNNSVIGGCSMISNDVPENSYAVNETAKIVGG